MNSLGAFCCRAMMLEGGLSLEDLQDLTRGAFFEALKGNKFAIGNIKFFSGLVLLPARWEDWPSDSKVVIVRENWREGVAYFRCRFLGADGLCRIYDRRPGTCRNFEPSEKVCSRCSSFGTTCHLPVQVRKAEEISA